MSNDETTEMIRDCLLGDDSIQAAIVKAGEKIAEAITPCAAPGRDEAGGHVESLTEAAMGITTGLCRIAAAIELLADAVRERSERPA